MTVSKRSFLICLLCWGYALLVLALWFMVSQWGDRWWPATLILFGPRWVVALPIIVLFPLAIWQGWSSLVPLFVGILIVFGPFMGFNLPSNEVVSPGGRVLRVLTCNIDNGRCNMQSLSDLIRESCADIVALQESPGDVAKLLRFPKGWQSVQDGELTLLSRYPLRLHRTIKAFHPPHKWPRACLLQCNIEAYGREISFNVVHLLSPRYGLQAILDRSTLISLNRKKLLKEETVNRWSVARQVQQAVALQTLPVIVAGDFNMPTDSSIYRNVWGAYANLFTLLGFGYGWTERADVRGVPIRVRIDHVLTGNGLQPKLCRVGPDIGSDHLPVIADIGAN